MTILVTGGAGFIGSHIVYALLDAGEQVAVVDNFSTGFRTAISDAVPVHAGDINDLSFLSQVFGSHDIDAVIHLAGSSVVPESLRNPLAYYRNNTSASRNLMDAAIAHSVRKFVFSSTAAVYGNPSQKGLLTEDIAVNPLSAYGTSKLMTEMMLRDAAQAHDFRFVALRYFNVAGADSKMRTGQSTKNATHLIKIAVQTALGLRERVEVYGTDYETPDGTCIRDYIHVSDLAAAHMSALRYLGDGGDSLTLNCGYGRGYSVLEVIEAVKRVSGRDFEVAFVAKRPGDPEFVVADAGRAREILDWSPNYDDLDTIITHALAWEESMTR